MEWEQEHNYKPQYNVVETNNVVRKYQVNHTTQHFMLVHRTSDTPGLIKLKIPNPIHFNAQTEYARIGLSDMTYLDKWSSFDGEANITLSILDNSDATNIRPVIVGRFNIFKQTRFSKLSDIYELMEFYFLRQLAIDDRVKRTISKVNGGAGTDLEIQQIDDLMDFETFIEMKLLNDTIFIFNKHPRLTFSFSQALQSYFNVQPIYFIPPSRSIDIFLQAGVERKEILLKMPQIKTTLTDNGQESILQNVHYAYDSNKPGMQLYTPQPHIQMKELEIPCTLSEITIYITTLDGKPIHFSEALVQNERAGRRSQRTYPQDVDCVINLTLESKTLI